MSRPDSPIPPATSKTVLGHAADEKAVFLPGNDESSTTTLEPKDQKEFNDKIFDALWEMLPNKLNKENIYP